MRGLKPLPMCLLSNTTCRILYGCVDWNFIQCIKSLCLLCRILYGCVDWNRWCGKLCRSEIQSHPLRMRGLKHMLVKLIRLLGVASFTDAWIETDTDFLLWVIDRFIRRILYGCVDWNRRVPPAISLFSVASFTDAWIETSFHFALYRLVICRILYGCVDWNTSQQGEPSSNLAVASFTDAWIETVYI